MYSTSHTHFPIQLKGKVCPNFWPINFSSLFLGNILRMSCLNMFLYSWCFISLICASKKAEVGAVPPNFCVTLDFQTANQINLSVCWNLVRDPGNGVLTGMEPSYWSTVTQSVPGGRNQTQSRTRSPKCQVNKARPTFLWKQANWWWTDEPISTWQYVGHEH